MNLIIHNSFHDTTPSHTGDAILSRPIITTIRNTFSDINIILQFEKKHHYLFSDLGLSLMERTPIAGLNYNAWFGYYTDILDIYGMSYFGQVHSFNRQMEGQGLPYRLTMPDIHPMLSFPPHEGPLAALPNSILIENGICLSGQSFIEMNTLIPRLVNDFKDFYFYTSSKSPVPVYPTHGLFDLCHFDLITLHHFSNLCTALITRGSGVNAVCYSDINRNKPRAIVGWNYSYLLWDNNNFINCRSYDELCQFINKLRKG